MSLVGVAIAATIKEAAAGHVPHVVQTDNNTYVSWQAFQPCWNIKPIRDSMQMYNINVCQLFRTRRQQQSPGPMPRLARQRHGCPANQPIQKKSGPFSRRIFAKHTALNPLLR